MMSRIYLQANNPDQWAQFLADPIKHWRKGYSARTLAYSWQEAAGFPVEVQATLATAEAFTDIEMLLGIPEHQVPLPGGSRPSQNDLWLLARCSSGLVSIAVEGKVGEPFGPTVAEWQAEGSKGKDKRLSFLCNLLGLNQPVPGEIRYQLLHRTASALIEAQRFGAPHAVMLVHSFSQTCEWFEDYAAFAKLLGVQAEVNRIVSVGERGGTELHLGWVCGDARYLEK